MLCLPTPTPKSSLMALSSFGLVENDGLLSRYVLILSDSRKDVRFAPELGQEWLLKECDGGGAAMAFHSLHLEVLVSQFCGYFSIKRDFFLGTFIHTVLFLCPSHRVKSSSSR